MAAATAVTIAAQLGAKQFQGLFDVIAGSATLNPASLIDAAGETETVAVPGAALGDFVLVSFAVDLSDLALDRPRGRLGSRLGLRRLGMCVPMRVVDGRLATFRAAGPVCSDFRPHPRSSLFALC